MITTICLYSLLILIALFLYRWLIWMPINLRKNDAFLEELNVTALFYYIWNWKFDDFKKSNYVKKPSISVINSARILKEGFVASLLSDPKIVDEIYILGGTKSWTRKQLAEEVQNETEFGKNLFNDLAFFSLEVLAIQGKNLEDIKTEEGRKKAVVGKRRYIFTDTGEVRPAKRGEWKGWNEYPFAQISIFEKAVKDEVHALPIFELKVEEL